MSVRGRARSAASFRRRRRRRRGTEDGDPSLELVPDALLLDAVVFGGGSGMVESANKLVVEDRLKGAGMHWADVNINPLLALRNAVCNDRWDECWAVIEREQRGHVAARRQARCRTRTAAHGVEIPAAAAAARPPVRPLVRPLEPEVTSAHPWTRAWSVHRQRELAGVL